MPPRARTNRRAVGPDWTRTAPFLRLALFGLVMLAACDDALTVEVEVSGAMQDVQGLEVTARLNDAIIGLPDQPVRGEILTRFIARFPTKPAGQLELTVDGITNNEVLGRGCAVA